MDLVNNTAVPYTQLTLPKYVNINIILRAILIVEAKADESLSNLMLC